MSIDMISTTNSLTSTHNNVAHLDCPAYRQHEEACRRRHLALTRSICLNTKLKRRLDIEAKISPFLSKARIVSTSFSKAARCNGKSVGSMEVTVASPNEQLVVISPPTNQRRQGASPTSALRLVLAAALKDIKIVMFG